MINELNPLVAAKYTVKEMQHVNNKTVRFYPLSISEDNDHHILNGYWIAIDTNEPIVRETIKIKKVDLANWYVV